MIESHLPLVRSIARRYAGRGETVEDLIQVGAIALIRASDRYDPSRGVSFAAFATPAVEGEMRRHLGDQTGSVRIPRQLRQMTGELSRSRAQLAATLGRPPSVDELAGALGVEHDDVERALKAERAREPSTAVSDEPAGDAELGRLTDDRLVLAAGAHVLDDRERRIVFLRFHADLTEREIAREVGISQAQVSRVLTRALTKLREELDHENVRAGGGDSTENRVVSPGDGGNLASPSPRTPAKSESSEGAGARIAGVGALEGEALPKEDLELPYHVTVKPEGGDRRTAWMASVDELPGCEARGETPDQAVANLRSAMESWLSAAAEEPRVISPPRRRAGTRKSSHSGRFLVRMPSDLHMELTRAAEREQVSLNRFVTERLAASVASSGAGAVGGTSQTPGEPASPKRSFRMLLAANALIMVLAAAAAVVLLVLALQRGI